MEDKLQKIIARINQLRAISKSTHSQAEAETTLSLASRLVAQYQLDEATIQAETGKNDDPIDLDGEHIIYESSRITRWKSELAIELAHLNGLFIYNACAQVIKNNKSRKITRYRIIGKKSNIALALYMFDFLSKEIKELCDVYVSVGSHRGVNPEKESWSLGCVRGFVSKMKSEKNAVMSKTANNSALVLIGNQAAEAETAFKNKTGITLKQNNYTSKGQITDNYFSGYQRGQTLVVTPALQK